MLTLLTKDFTPDHPLHPNHYTTATKPTPIPRATTTKTAATAKGTRERPAKFVLDIVPTPELVNAALVAR